MSIKSLAEYALLKSQGDPGFSATLRSLLGSSDAERRIGLIFSERLINMPVQVVPHMYRMLVDELQVAVEKASVSYEQAILMWEFTGYTEPAI